MAILSWQPWRKRRWERRTRKVEITRKRKSQIVRCRRWWRYYYLRLMRLQGTTEAIARGLAVGSFAGMFPIMGFQIIFGIFLAILVRGNKIIAAAATWISNPFTYLPIFAFNFWVGQWLLGTHQLSFSQLDNIRDLNQLLHLGGGFLATLFTGCAFMGSLVAAFSYGFGHWGVHQLRKRYKRRKRRRTSS